jgi:hypothetical protein
VDNDGEGRGEARQ